MSALSDALASRLEKQYGAPFQSVRELGRASSRLFGRYMGITLRIERRSYAPVDAYCAVRIRSAQAMDCGSCVQIEVNAALMKRVDAEVIRAILHGDLEAGTPLAAACAWADATIRDRVDDTESRTAVETAYGKKAMAEMAMAMAGSAYYPTVKRALGHSVSCDLTTVEIAAKQG